MSVLGLGGFGAVLGRDLRLAGRQGSDVLLVVGFFVLGAVLFPFAVGPDAKVLARIAGGVIWVMALLAAMLSLDRLFQADYEDGSLELLVLSPLPLGFLVLAKCLAHWLTTGLPLLLAAPVLAILLNLPLDGFAALVAAMALGTPTLSLLGAVGAAVSLGARRSGVLVSLLVLPLTVPVLIFGVAAVDAAVGGYPTAPHLMLLAALFLAALPLCPWAASAALRHAVE
ncbi:heme exporter protein CcmB [Oceanibaculum indicum]|uniref:Heme exporter protein B n=1 Tax=Oceanibaculum indicum TaxID=526216 RepID=A0A420WRD1_9PROT|nr:heme exporter protein CcmB [Oceanibaculum indicum]RKQ73604.1 heme exporter protein B [Oceanibaculum indicum]